MKANFTALTFVLSATILLTGCTQKQDIEGTQISPQIQNANLNQDFNATYEISQQIPAGAVSVIIEYVDALNFGLATGDLRRFAKSAKKSCTCLKPAIGINELYQGAVVIGGRYEITQIKLLSNSDNQIEVQLFLERSTVVQMNLRSGNKISMAGVASNAHFNLVQKNNKWQIKSSSL